MTTKDTINIDALISKFGIISDQVERNELTALLQEFLYAIKSDGSIVEFGCYIGTTSLYIRRMLDLLGKKVSSMFMTPLRACQKKEVKTYHHLGRSSRQVS